MNFLAGFDDDDDDDEIIDEELTKLIDSNKAKYEDDDSATCVDCKVPMNINMEHSQYVCHMCGRAEKYLGDSVAEMDKNHKVTISSSGKAYLAGDSTTIKDGVWRELSDMNMALNNQIHQDIIEKIFNILITIRLNVVNRGQVRNSIRARCTIDVCRKNGVLISDESIYAACGITNKRINDGVRMMDYAYIAGVLKEDDEDTDDTEQLIDTIIKNLGFSADQRNLLVLYVRQHQKLSSANRKPISRIAGAMYYMSNVLNMGIEIEDLSNLASVSKSTIEQICNEYAIINEKLSQFVKERF